MGGGGTKDLALKLKDLTKWLEAQIRQNPTPETKRTLQRALEFARMLQDHPTEQQLLDSLDVLLSELGQNPLRDARTLYQRQLLGYRSASDTIEKLSNMRFSGPRDQCPNCGENKDRCSCPQK